MKDFSEATFVPEIVDVMTEALDASVATLPHPVSSTQVNLLAESILRTAQSGERDPAILQRMALLELTITPRPSDRAAATASGALPSAVSQPTQSKPTPSACSSAKVRRL